MSIDPGDKGALDVYVPLVDWGARFEAIPALRCGSASTCRPIDRTVAQESRRRGNRSTSSRRAREARDALASYLKKLIALVVAAAPPFPAGRVRHPDQESHGSRWTLPAGDPREPRHRRRADLAASRPPARSPTRSTTPTAPTSRARWKPLRPPEGRAASSTRSSTPSWSASPASSSPPAAGRSISDQPVITVASDLHNNTVGLGVLERLSNGGPVFFVGDLTDRGSQLETRAWSSGSRAAASRSCS